MTDASRTRSSKAESRRSFLKTSGATVAGGALLTGLAVPRSVHAAGDDVLKVGLIGCGSRGTGAAVQALNADKNVKLTAMGDVFEDQLQASLANLRKQNLGDKLAVTPENCFVGFDAYQKVLETDVDVVLLTTPPHFRPMHFKAAVAAGKHVFAEKPVAVDAPGVRSVLETVEEAKRKKLSVVSGLCWRYHENARQLMSQVHDGRIGRIIAMHVSFNTGPLRVFPRKSEWTDMENQLRNWLYYTWLSGDHIVEQHVHSLDKAAWAMLEEQPVSAFGVGGRQVRTAPEYGNIYDHHAVCFEYANGVKLFSYCRQGAGCYDEVADHFMGDKGIAHISGMKQWIDGENPWTAERSRENASNMFQQEHDELFASIRSGQPINNGDYMAKSTLMAIMGRMATYTGQKITWDAAMNSKEDLSPPKYEFGPLPTPPVAMPGLTQFV